MTLPPRFAAGGSVVLLFSLVYFLPGVLHPMSSLTWFLIVLVLLALLLVAE